MNITNVSQNNKRALFRFKTYEKINFPVIMFGYRYSTQVIFLNVSEEVSLRHTIIKFKLNSTLYAHMLSYIIHILSFKKLEIRLKLLLNVPKFVHRFNSLM